MSQGLSPAACDHDVGLKILEALQGIRYGSVEIIIHDSRVVQIERKEKLRIGTSRSPL